MQHQSISKLHYVVVDNSTILLQRTGLGSLDFILATDNVILVPAPLSFELPFQRQTIDARNVFRLFTLDGQVENSRFLPTNCRIRIRRNYKPKSGS